LAFYQYSLIYNYRITKMSTIVTLTFSPCIDKSTSVPAVVSERKLTCTAPALEPGGGGINVARVIHRLGGDVIAVFPSGGYTGEYFNYLLEREEIPSVIIKTANETRENIIVLDEFSNAQYRFGMPGTALRDHEWQQCLTAVENIPNAEFIIASGSLPPGVPLDVYAMLAKIAKSKNARFVVDTSGEALKHAVDEGVYLLKPSLRELCTLLNRDSLAIPDIKDAVKCLLAEGKCEIIIVSMGAEGAMLLTRDIAEFIAPPLVPHKSTVGAGDSMLGGIVYSLSKGQSIIDAVHYGVACGTAATMNAGTQLCQKEDVNRLFQSIRFPEV
jgi:6-phosphofructokinase 2